jgi:DNA gyrase subunit B
MNSEDAVTLFARAEDDKATLKTELVSEEDGDLVVRGIENKTGLAQTHRLPRALFDSKEYREFVKVHQSIAELAGTPAFSVRLGDRGEEAPTFEALRQSVLSVAQKGVTLNRFKGLGEMNADQLADTTMNPATRTLQQVSIEDAADADRLFSMLMGDVVEHRREFIEDNALAATVDV